MPSRGEIKSEKILVKDIFSQMWFHVPEYQRPYVWSREEISDLLDDLTFAMTEKPDFEHFMGSFVFQSKPRHRITDRNLTRTTCLTVSNA